MMEENVRVIYKEKNSTIKIIVIIILSILLVSSLFYIGYIKYKELTKEEIIEEENIREEIYYSEVEQILSQIEMYNEVFKDKYPLNDLNKIDNQQKLQFGILALQKIEKTYNYYKINDIKKMYNKYLTSKFKVVYEDIKCPANDKNLYELNSDTKTYEEINDHAHGKVNMDTTTYFVSANINEDKYIINTHILYSNYCSGTCNPEGGYYKSYNDCVDGKNPITYRISEYKKIKDKLPITEFTFIKDEENFRLESIKINK